MPLATDNKTLQLLRAFSQRRRRLILLRGIGAVLLALVVSMLAVAIADRFVVMETPARVALSLCAYLATIVVAWFIAGRHLVRRDRPADLARMLETAEPALRDRLLAAIELGEHANGAAAFRDLVRTDAARRAGQVRVERTLPWRLIGWWMAAGAGAVVLCAGLLAVPQLQFGRMLGRALLPTAGIPRASRYTVVFTGSGESRMVPGGEASRFEVVVTGGTPRAVTLDVLIGDGEKRRVPMEPTVAGRYAAAVVLDGPARLRAWADDADTRWLSVETRPRPSVMKFTKRYLPPAYLVGHAEPTVPLTEDSGALSALEGSTAELRLLSDQAIASGHLELLGSDGQPVAGVAPVPLAIEADARNQTASVPVTFNGTYRVQLVARETGFDTPQAPLWPISVLPDGPPVVTAESGEHRPVAADALVGLRATASDDVGLAWTRQDVRVNGGHWRQGQIEQRSGLPRRAQITTPLDLLSMQLVPGDRVEARLVASDLKGSQGIGSFGELVVVSDGLDDATLKALAAKQRIAVAAGRFAQATGTLHAATGNAAARLASLENEAARDSIQTDQVWLALRADLRTTQQAAEELLRTATAAVSELHAGRDAADAELIGAAASEALREILADFAVLNDSPTPQDDATEKLDAAENGALWAAQIGEQAVTLAESAVRAEQASLAAQETLAMARDVPRHEAQLDRDLADDEALAWQQFARSAAAMAARAQAARERLDEARVAARPGALSLVDASRTNLDRAADRLRRGLREQPGERLREPMTFAFQATLGTYEQLVQVTAELEVQAEVARRKLAVSPTSRSLDRLARVLADTSPDWSRPQARLADRAALHERRADLDRAFLGDLGLSSQALRAMRAAAEQSGDASMLQERAEAVARASATLEAGHALAELSGRLETLAQVEQTEVDRPVLERVRDWVSFAGATQAAAEQLRRGRHEAAAVERVKQVSDSGGARRARELIGQGLDEEEALQLAAALRVMGDELQGARQQIEPAMAEARRVLAQEAMPLEAWMEQLAAQAEAMAKQTPQGDAAGALAEQEAFEQKLEELEDALRRDAAQQDLLTDQGRQRARDADDATAMLQPDADQAREALEQAQISDAQQQPQKLNEAAQAQQRSAETLRQLAGHYRKLEESRGDPAAADETRAALRQEEAELGLKERLDAEYARMERLAEMQGMSERDMLEALEQEVKQDQSMQRELGRLADEAARRGQQEIDQAAEQERAVEEGLEEATREGRSGERRGEQRQQRLAQAARELAEKQVPQLQRQLPEENGQPQSWARDLEQAQQELRDASEAAEQGNLQQAAEALKQARDTVARVEQAQDQQAAQAQQQARESANRVNEAQQPGQPPEQVQAAQQQAQEARQAARQAQQRQEAAQQLREDASRLARQAEQERAAQAARQAAKQSSLEQAAEAQDEVQQSAQGAAEDLERAARHEERLGNEDKSEAMQQAAEGSRQASQQEVPAAQRAAQEAREPSEARPAASEARERLEQQSAQAQQAQATPDNQPSPAASDRAGQMMAQALDRLDRAMSGQQRQQGQGEQKGQQGQGQQPGEGLQEEGQQGQQGQGEGQGQGQGEQGQGQQGQGQHQQGQGQGQAPGQGRQARQQGQGGQPGEGTIASELARAMAQRAAEAQARTMRNRRLPNVPGQPGGEPTGDGADLRNMAEGGELGEVPGRDGGDWGRLPPEVVKDLLQGQRDVAPAEYRDLVEAYYRAIADKARQAPPK